MLGQYSGSFIGLLWYSNTFSTGALIRISRLIFAMTATPSSDGYVASFGQRGRLYQS
jgi:hypothetical protein